MSEQLNGDQQPEVGKLKIVCPKCTVHFSVQLSAPEVANNIKTSIVTLSHEKATRCINCHQAFILMLTPNVQLQVYAQPVGDEVFEEEKRIIVPEMQTPKLKLM